MLRNKPILFALLIIVFLLAVYFLWGRNWGTTSQTDTAFAFTDTTAITKIVMTDKENRKLTLTRKSADTWLVNDGYKARPDAINTLLNTFAQMRMDRPISNASKKYVTELFEKPERTVQIYTKNPDKPAHEYYIGGVTNDKLGTYMQLKGADKPYVVTMPGLEGNLMSRHFTLAEEWRDRLMFNLHYAAIKTISLEYPEAPKYGFRLTVAAKDSFVVEPTLPTAAINHPKAMLNKPLIMSYLNSFKELYAEAYENGYPRTDSLRKTEPFCRLSVTDNNGKTKSMQIHYMPNNRRSKRQVDENGNPILTDPDRYLAFINNGSDLVMIQQFVFGKLFRRYPEFVVVPKN